MNLHSTNHIRLPIKYTTPKPSNNQKQNKRLKKKFFNGTWTPKQHFLYFKFVLDHEQVFKNEKERKKCRIFFRMSEAVKTRNTSQCKSHHQKKMLSSSNSLSKLLQTGRQKYCLPFGDKTNEEWWDKGEGMRQVGIQFGRWCLVDGCWRIVIQQKYIQGY